MTAATIALSVAATLAAIAAVRWHGKFRKFAKAYVDCLTAKDAYDSAVREMSRRIAIGEPGVVPAPAVPLGAGYAEALVNAWRTDADMPLTYDRMKAERDCAAVRAGEYKAALDVLDVEVFHIPERLRDVLDKAVGVDVLPVSRKVWICDMAEDLCDKARRSAADRLSRRMYTASKTIPKGNKRA